MSVVTLERTDSLQAHPNITTAARIVGVSPATISRRDDLISERRGERDVVLAPAEVLRLALVYRKRSLNEVAEALIALAGEHGPNAARRVEDEIEQFVETHQEPSIDNDEFLATAKRLLPASLYASVEHTLNIGQGERPRAIVGYKPKS